KGAERGWRGKYTLNVMYLWVKLLCAASVSRLLGSWSDVDLLPKALPACNAIPAFVWEIDGTADVSATRVARTAGGGSLPAAMSQGFESYAIASRTRRTGV